MSGSRASSRTLSRRVAAGVIGAAVAVALGSPAAAARPDDPACLGQDIRSYAQGGAVFGGFVSGMATTGQGIGAEIQAHRAGQLSDEALPNSCND